LEKIKQIIKLLKPKYYNRITYLIVLTGCSLLTKPIWLDIVNALFETSNENNNQIQFALIGNWDWLLGIFLIILGLWWNTRNRMLDLKHSKSSNPEFKNVQKVEFNTDMEVYKAIYPIIKDNEYIFKSVGPNSNARETDDLRSDLTLWYKYRSEAIIPNNQKIKEILLKNKSLFKETELEVVQKMITHIDAFEEHVKNPDFDYSEHQFPTEFPEIIEDKCFIETKSSKQLKNQIKWLLKKLKRLELIEIYAIGSALIIPKRANDLDVIILLKDNKVKEQINLIESIKLDFKLKFKLGLHTTTFTSNENSEFESFIDNNRIKLKLNG
jgi:hypothetical protein